MTRQFPRLFLLLAAIILTAGCAKLTLAWADIKPSGPTARPDVLGVFADEDPVTSPEDWTAERAPLLRAVLEKEVYGTFPDKSSTRILDKRRLNDEAFGGAGVLEEWTLTATASFNGETVEARPFPGLDGFLLEVVLPAEKEEPVPIIIMETFCPSWEVAPDPAIWRPEDAGEMGGLLGGVMTYVFGRYICTPPFEMILQRGYGVAVLYPQSVPDRRKEGLAELKRLSQGHVDDRTRWGAVAAWGWLFSRAVDALDQDPRIDRDGLIVWGHSRYGKAALVAAAWDARIDAVIAHQSGTGGASLNRDKKGESVGAITSAYPHWFAQNYEAYAGREEEMCVDQHMLLALIAPRPALLGNARRDVWSDPNGAFRAAQGADPVYELLGSGGLSQQRLDQWRPEADIAFWLRPGTHGVVKEDWPAFLDFLDAHAGN